MYKYCACSRKPKFDCIICLLYLCLKWFPMIFLLLLDAIDGETSFTVYAQHEAAELLREPSH